MSKDKTEDLLEGIAAELVARGEITRPYSFALHARQGYNSQVYVLSSGSTELIVNLAKPFEHYYADQVWEKLCALSAFLRRETKLPIARIIFAKPMQDFVVCVQEKLSGDIAGAATIIGNQVIYTWFQDKSVLMLHIQEMLAAIHNLPMTGYGLPAEQGGIFQGTSPTWKEFLLQRMALWLEALSPEKKNRALAKELHAEIQVYAEQVCAEAPMMRGSLIHGDLGNPSNVLGEHGEVTGLIDWEFALIADPAWEFCDEGWTQTVEETKLKVYFQARGMNAEQEREAFLRRIVRYRPLQCLMWLYVHRNDETSEIFDTCVALLQKDLAEAKRCG